MTTHRLLQPATLRLVALTSAFALALGACGGSEDGSGASSGGSGNAGSGASGGSGNGGSGAGGSGATGGQGGGDGWQLLVSGDWSMDPGDEGYVCVRYTLPEDMYVSGFRPIAPFGTHHTVLSVEDDGKPDGQYDCTGGMNGPRMLYGSGVGTDPLQFPAGVAVKISAGEQINLNLHLFNATPDTISGTSAIEVLPVDASEVQHEAIAVLAGKDQGLFVDTGETTETGLCTAPIAVNVFAVMPHMHTLGSHMKVASLGSNPSTLLDTDYDFEEQRFRLVDPPAKLQKGDQLQVDCTYINDTGDAVHYGESTLDEMCYAGTYIYAEDPTIKLQTSGVTCTK